MTHNTIILSDLTLPAQGRLFAFLQSNGKLVWCIEIMSTCVDPFPVYITAQPLSELSEVKFDIEASEFSHQLTESSSFVFSSGGDAIDIGSFTVTIEKKSGNNTKEITFRGKGRVDAMAGPKYMRNVECRVSVGIPFDFYQVPNHIPIDDAIKQLKSITGIEGAIKYVKKGGGGTHLYGIE